MTLDTVAQIASAIVVLIILLLPFYWQRFRIVATFWRRTGSWIDDGEVGLAALRLPRGWKGNSNAASTAAIQATDRLGRRFVAVFSDSLEDFTQEMTLEQFYSWTMSRVAATTRILEIDGPHPCTVGPFNAMQTETLVLIEPNLLIRQLRTLVAGERGIHQIVAWATPSAFNRSLFVELREGFRELPGPKPRLRPALLPPPASSDYDVH